MPKVSIVVPMYNVEEYLDRCIESLLNQTYKDIEIICVDDGSPDKSGEIAEGYAEKDSRLKVVHKENAGLGYARNTGIENSTGKYVVFIDSDDYISGNLVEELVNAAEKQGADTVIAGHSRVKGDSITEIPNPIAGKTFKGKDILSEVLYKMVGPLGDGSDSINMAAWRVLYSLDIIREYNLRYPSEREFISEDIIFDLKYYRYSKVVSGIKNCGYMYCMNPGSLTERYNAERFEKGRILFEEKKRLIKEIGDYSGNVKFRTEESFLRYSRYAIKSEVKFAKENGKAAAKKNLMAIISNETLSEMVTNHNNKLKSKIDKVVDYCIKKRKASLLFNVLKAGYLIKK